MQAQAYRRYLIQRNPFDGRYYVSRDGFHMGSYATLDDAKHNIDLLLD